MYPSGSNKDVKIMESIVLSVSPHKTSISLGV